MAQSEIICEKCKKVFLRENKEINRRIKQNKKMFCSKICSSKYASDMLYESGYYTLTFKLLDNAKKRSKKCNYEFNLDNDFLVDLFEKQNKKCAISGLPIFFRKNRDQKKYPNQVSIDRLNDKKGYTKDNVQLTALCINYMRNTFSLKDIKCVLEEIKTMEH